MSARNGLNSSQGDLLDVLFLAEDEELSVKDLRKRWMFQQPSAAFVSLVPVAFAFCFFAPFYGIGWLGVLALAVTLVVSVLVRSRLVRKAASMNREQLITGIQMMRGIRADSVPF